jgi:hypothetical protein
MIQAAHRVGPTQETDEALDKLIVLRAGRRGGW